MSDEQLVLVDQEDRDVGVAGKLVVHQQGWLHRAVSVCLFDDSGHWLLQKRHEGKYHSPGLLANSCCSHPHPGESPRDGAVRRVREELGVILAASSLRWITSFRYKVAVPPLIEHEYDHLFAAVLSSREIVYNCDEVSEVWWATTDEVMQLILQDPGACAPWFPLVAHQMVSSMCSTTLHENRGQSGSR